MNASLAKELLVVVRTVKERSLPLCIDAVRSQTDHYVVIEEYPHLTAVKKTFALGVEKRTPFLLALDADVILYPDALKSILQEAKEGLTAYPNMVCMDCRVTDKFRGATVAGCHIYAGQYLKDIVSHFSNVEYSRFSPSPESSNILALARKRSLELFANTKEVGLHDYEQFYNHLYIKYYRRAIRWPQFIPTTLANIRKRHFFHPKDLDFDVVWAGYRAGIGQKEVPFDARLYPSIKDLMGLEEKEPLG
jgi:hypothetical protein